MQNYNQNDVFIETIVKRKMTAKDKLMILGLVFAALLLLAVAFVFIEYVIAFLPILVIGIGYGFYLLVTQLDKEYEYICTNGQLDIDVIIHKRKRKRIISIAAKEMEILAPIQSDEYKTYAKNTNLKHLNLTTNSGSENVWFFVGHYKGSNYLVTFEPNERILNDLKRHNPSKVKHQLTHTR